MVLGWQRQKISHLVISKMVYVCVFLYVVCVGYVCVSVCSYVWYVCLFVCVCLCVYVPMCNMYMCIFLYVVCVSVYVFMCCVRLWGVCV